MWNNAFAVYRIEITAREKWTIYRRYSAFENLHKALLNELGQAYIDAGIVFPERDYQGSFFASRSSMVSQRIPLLQKFLNDIILKKVPSIRIKTFFDFDEKGISGVRCVIEFSLKTFTAK